MPLLITGTPRSGSTLLSKLINNHPHYICFSDSVNYLRFYDISLEINSLYEVQKIIKNVSDRIIKRWDMKFDKELVTDLCTQKSNCSHKDIYNEIMFQLTQSKNWGEKTTNVFDEIPDFLNMFPEGHVIQIIRDPRAVLASWKKFTKAPENDYLDILYNCLYSMRKALEYREKYDFRNYILIRYEDLVRYPEYILENICLAFDWEVKYREMLEMDKCIDKSGKLWTSNSSFRKHKNVSKKSIDTWKDKLQDWEILLTENMMKKYMKKFHYKLLNIKDENIRMKMANKILDSNLFRKNLNKYSKTGHQNFWNDPTDEKNWIPESQQLNLYKTEWETP